jgi:putative nucleotidyltransferase with HDIG domain
MYIQVFKQANNNGNLNNLLRNIWTHSLSVANCAKKISSKIKKNYEFQEATYMAGLLHDIGKIVILNNNSFCKLILDEIEINNLDYNTAELNVLEVNHATVGAYLLSLWGLPEAVILSAQNHLNPTLFNSDNLQEPEIIFLANLLNNDKEKFILFLKRNNLLELSEICIQ